MCLAVPGKILCIDGEALDRVGRVSFGGTVREVNLSLVPEAAVGEYVIVHVGVALNTLNEAEAQQVFAYLQEMNELAEVEEA